MPGANWRAESGFGIRHQAGTTSDYTYDPESNRYLRVMDGYRHRDLFTGEQLAATNVIL